MMESGKFLYFRGEGFQHNYTEFIEEYNVLA